MGVEKVQYHPSTMSQLLAWVQLCAVKNLLKSGLGTHFNCKSSHLQPWNEDSQLKQVPHPILSKIFLPHVIVLMWASVTLHLMAVLYLLQIRSHTVYSQNILWISTISSCCLHACIIFPPFLYLHVIRSMRILHVSTVFEFQFIIFLSR